MQSGKSIGKAIDYLEKSLKTYRQLFESAGTGGDRRSLYSTMATLAQAYCVNKEFDRGLGMFHRAITEESSHVGPRHFQLGLKYLNAGMCSKEAGKLKEALKYFQSCSEVVRLNPTHFDKAFVSVMRNRIEATISAINSSEL